MLHVSTPLKVCQGNKNERSLFLDSTYHSLENHTKFRNSCIDRKDALLTGEYGMKMLHVTHHPGRHCASTGLRNIVNFQNFSWSEPLCFGIGAGLSLSLKSASENAEPEFKEVSEKLDWLKKREEDYHSEALALG